MIVEERNKSVWIISFSLAGMLALFLLRGVMERREIDAAWALLGGLVLFLTYAWGLSCLAHSKGQSSAIVLTAVFGLLPPLIILVILPDINRHRGVRPRRPRPQPTTRAAWPSHPAPKRVDEESLAAARN